MSDEIGIHAPDFGDCGGRVRNGCCERCGADCIHTRNITQATLAQSE